jgi:Ca2+-binding RTX toxin-like protein
MAKLRIERELIKEAGLWLIGADHLLLVFQQDEFDDGSSQEIWRVLEGTYEPGLFGPTLLGVAGADEIRTLSSSNGGLTGDALREVISTPWWRGSTVLPSFTPASDWAISLSNGRQIDQQNYSYFVLNLPFSPLPTANSSSVVASLLYYIGIDIAQNMPSQWLSFTTGTKTLLGNFSEDYLELTDSLSFDTILSGDGEDRLKGTHNSTILEKFYGGRDDDVFDWSGGVNYYHGGQPDLDYALDGSDRLNYAGVGGVLITAGDSPVPHLSPDYLAFHSGQFMDKLFSIDKLSWYDESDTVLFGEGVNFENVRLELDFEQELPDTQGDLMDFSNQSSGLLLAPSDRPDIVLVGAANQDGEFTDGGIWARSLEWMIASKGNDLIYASSTLLGVEGGEGQDLISGRNASVLTGASPLGYDIELSGGDGDDTIISGMGRSLANGGAGADTFILSSLSAPGGVTEFVIEGADTSDRLLVPFNFLVPDAGPFDGSELFPILGAISPVIGGATFGNLPQNPGPGPLGGMDDPGFFYLASQVPLDGTWSGSWDGRITITDQIAFNRDGNDLLIHVWNAGVYFDPAFLTISGQDFVFQQMDPDRGPEAVIRVVDFSEGMLGINFYELGWETPFPFPGGSGPPNPSKLWNTAQFAQGNSLLSDALDAEPETPIFDRPSEGETEVRDQISGNEQDNDLIVIASARIPGEFNTGADISGGGGDDQLTGGAGRDTLDGGTGADVMAGGRGDDRYVVDSAGDVVTEAATSGFDEVIASIDYTLTEHVENLTLTGAAVTGQGNVGNNLIRGNDASNVLIGLEGKDRLQGGRGDDILDGGEGNDLYVYVAGDGNDTIVSGGAASGVDTLRIFGFEPHQVSAFQSASGSDVILRLVDGSRIVLQDFFAGGSIAAVGFENDFVWDAAAIGAAAQAAGPLLNDAPVVGDDLGLVAGSRLALIPKTLLLANDRDMDGDTLAIVAVESLTAGFVASLTVGGDVQVAAAPGQAGLMELTYSVSDGNGGITTGRINITIIDNEAPVVSGDPIGAVEAEPGFDWIFDVPSDLFTDPEGEAVFVRAALADGSALPDWLTFDPLMLRFEGTLPEDFEGDLVIRLTGSDGPAETETTFVLRAQGAVEGLALFGTSIADVLVGGEGPDEFFGLGGHDTLLGGAGDDVFWASGNAGNDMYDGGSGFDEIRGTAGDDVIGVRASLTTGPTGQPVHVVLAGIEAIEGGDGFDVLRFENTADFIDLSMVDVSGIEQIQAGGGPDTVIGSSGNDVIVGGGHHDVMFGGDGDDVFLFTGLEGMDTFDGGEGLDTIQGSQGDDVLFINGGSASLASIEIMDFGDGFDILRMHTANDVLDLSGVEVHGLEQIEGGAGADWIKGSSGNEILVGGIRQDTFVFADIFGQDTIADFQLQLHPRANGDLIDLSSFGFESYLDVLDLTHEMNGHSVIQLSQVDSSITILNVAKSLLQADDFLL